MTGADVATFFTLQVLFLTLAGALAGHRLRQLNRRRGWTGDRARVVQVVLIGFVSFALVYVLFTRFCAENIFVPLKVTYPLSDDIVDVAYCGEVSDATVREIWLRLSIPPPMQPDFRSAEPISLLMLDDLYTDDRWVFWCTGAILYKNLYASGDWSEHGFYLLTLSLSWAGAINAAAVVWRLTRPSKYTGP